MSKKRVICIGDVHGCLDELKELLVKVRYIPGKDRCIVVGDLVDRGPDSAGCVKFVRTRGLDCLSGNHDNKFARYYLHEQKVAESKARRDKKLYKNPMTLRGDKKATYDALSNDDRKWLSELPTSIFLEKSDALVVHAGVKPNENIFKQSGDVYRHCRYIFKDSCNLATLDSKTFAQPAGTVLWAELYKGRVDIVYGHNVEDMEHPVIRQNENGGRTLGIDTGCCFGGKLTALILEPGQLDGFVQVDAKREYYARHSYKDED